MPIVAGTLDSIYASLDTYLQDHLRYADGSPVALKLHGVRRFVPPPDAAWVEVYYSFLGLQQRFMNRLTRTATGVPLIATERSGYLQLSIFQRARVFSRRYTLAAARDLVVGLFPDGEVLTIRDYSTDDAPPSLEPLGSLMFDGVQEHTLDLGQMSGLQQHVVQIATRYLEIASRSI